MIRSSYRAFASTLVLGMVGVLAPRPAAAQRDWIRPKQPADSAPPVTAAFGGRLGPAYRRLRVPAVTQLPIPSLTGMVGAIITEAEPNDSIAQATLVTLGDTASGTISPSNDIDWYAVDLTAGSVVDLDVTAARSGSAIDAVIALVAPDGESFLAYNDDWHGLDPRIVFPISTTGRYFVGIGGTTTTTGSYALAFGLAALDEVEPNDTPDEATVVAATDTVLATFSTSGDVDYFAVDVTDTVILSALASPSVSGAPLSLTLYGTDGTTVLDTVSDPGYGLPTLSHLITSAGRYYVAVRQSPVGGTTGLLYALFLGASPPGPGDPATIVATDLGYPSGLHALPSGDFVTLDNGQARIVRVTTAGDVTDVATFPSGYPVALTVDGYGDLLVSGYDYTAGGSVVWRFTLAGQRSILLLDSASSFQNMTVGPDGDLWVATCGNVCWQLRRYDPVGTLKSSRTISFYPYRLAFGPDGVLYATDGGQHVYRIGTSVTAVVTEANGSLDGLAFDKDGYVYVGTGYTNQIHLYSPTFELVGDVFAQVNVNGPLELAFGRDASGVTTARLFATNSGATDPALHGTLVELNPSGIRAAGWSVGASLLRLATTAIDTAVMGAPYADTLRLEAEGGTARWALLQGVLPPGVALDTATGVLAGVPAAAGSFEFTVRVTVGAQQGYGRFTLAVRQPTVSLDDAVDLLLGVTGALSDAEQTFLDLQGNHNGRYDIGDLRAWLQARAAAGNAKAAAWLARMGGPGGAR
jgi:sugar lactone lactonase YvrE